MKWWMSVGKFSKSKGKRGELELTHKLQELGFQGVYRSQQYCGSNTSADLLGIPQIHAEVKRCEKLSIYTAYEQAVHDAKGTEDTPIVFHRRNGKPWLVILSLEDWTKSYEKYISGTQ